MKNVHRLMHHRLLLTFFLVLAFFLAQGQSVLQSGQWVKVGVTETGIYKLDKNFLDAIGFPVNSIDPRTLKVFGNGGGGMLPQPNATERPFDLIENSILAVGQEDGTLDNADYFLFYGRSSDKINWSSGGVEYENNLYADTTYYFITYDGDSGKRISTVGSLAEQPAKITVFDDAIIHELDEENILKSGRDWFGEDFSPATQLSETFNFTLENVTSFEALELFAMARSVAECSFDVSVNDTQVGTLIIDPIPSGPGTTYSIKGEESYDEFPLSGASDNLKITFSFNPGEGVSIGYINWFIARVKRELSVTDSGIHFRSVESLDNAISSYSIENANGTTQVWDVTSGTEPAKIQHTLIGSTALFSSASDEIKEFVAFNGTNFPNPKSFGAVQNQSIKSNVAVDGIIVANPEFLAQAQRLADFHGSNSGLTVAVVSTQEVFNEFSSGMQDVTAIRDFAKYAYDEGGRLKYLLLFGDGSYDYKDRKTNNTNLVPIYESRQSLHPIFSHSSDDYFGFLEDSEGEWEESSLGDHTLEIGVGRLPVKTVQEAKTVVDKIIRYSTSPGAMGKWRNEIVYVADDGDSNIHMDHGEALSAIVDNSSNFNTRKLYLDAFEQEVTPSREESSALTRAINLAVKNGAFFIDFIGHGNTR
ncbi:MAG: type IX secretion system sortase PorU, partial [Cyclobacteriaceae bacterium]